MGPCALPYFGVDRGLIGASVFISEDLNNGKVDKTLVYLFISIGSIFRT